jgi:hypothetical protein
MCLTSSCEGNISIIQKLCVEAKIICRFSLGLFSLFFGEEIEEGFSRTELIGEGEFSGDS